MNIGFVSTWFERGASYVTKSYIDLLEDNHKIFVYARGGESYGKGSTKWDLPYVTWSPKLMGTNINFRHFKKWIDKNSIDTIFFNEQHEIDIVYKIKKNLPNIKIGSYIDYYKENTVKEFYLYDFLICNTKRHYSVFRDHPQCFYVPWGTDTELFKPKTKQSNVFTFFHSAGLSNRKGTTFVINAFIKGEIYKFAKLVIHIQKDFEKNFGYRKEELTKYNIEIIEKTVTAPGLYYLGDVYVYPTTLDGLGLTMYEALSSGLPVITTNHPPMNEVISKEVGYLVDVAYLRSRQDGYYWPLSIIDESSLIEGMKLFISNQEKLPEMKLAARSSALKNWDWRKRKDKIDSIFRESKVIMKQVNKDLISKQSLIERIYRRFGSSYLYVIYSKLK